MPFLFYDPTWIILLPAIILSIWASANVKSTFGKYSRMYNRFGLTGADAARKILDMNGLYDVRIERISGELTDNYDPRTNVVHLSESTYSSQSVAAVGVAAHEVGHAIQHATGYSPIKVRNAIVPAVNVCNMLSMPIIILGIILSYNQTLVDLGIILFSATVLFQLITLPVEFNASSRALRTLEGQNILAPDEMQGASKVLRAAALTYVAAALSSLLSLLRLILIFGDNRNSRD